MISRARSLQIDGSSDQQAAGRRNEEEEQQNVDVDNSHGAGDHSSDKAKDDDKQLAGLIKNGIIVLCSLLIAFCLEALLNLPGGIKPEQLQSKSMDITAGQLKAFLISDVSCFFLSLATVFLVTLASSFNYKYSLHLNSFMMGGLIAAAIYLFNDGLVLATNDRLAHDAFEHGIKRFLGFLAYLIIVGLLFSKEFRSKIRDLIN